jgi:CO/xanthine dehydrogenase Mo-binding subunit
MNGDAKDLPGSLKSDANLDSWIAVNSDGTVTIKTGKVEIGQGIMTAIGQIGAEELDITPARIRVQMADTGASPDERLTAGSESIQQSGTAVRYAAAAARKLIIDQAAERLGIPPEDLTVEDGVITSRSTNRQVSYWDLMAGRKFDHVITGAIAPKPQADHRLVGKALGRLDIPAKVFGGAAPFIQDLALPSLLHGRVLRPPSYDAQLVALDESAAVALPGVIKVVRDGRFVGVVAEREDQAIRGWEALKAAAEWREAASLPDEDQLYDWLVSQEADDFLIEDGSPEEKPVPEIAAPAGAAHTLEAIYGRPFQMHASIGPSCGIAVWRDDELAVWSHTQGIFPLRAALSAALRIPKEKIHAIHAENAGCYGHNGADDAALDAALLARAVPGFPVRVQWMREDEHRWEPYGSAMVIGLQASLDGQGKLMDWNCDIWTNAHSGRPRAKTETAGLVAAWHRATPVPPPKPEDNQGKHGGGHRGATPYYDVAVQRIVKHVVKPHPLRVSSLRALGTFGNVFAQESFMDELAQAACIDPVAFRLSQLSDPRARAVIEAVVKMSGWDPAKWGEGKGQGLAFHRYKNSKTYAAVVCEVEVDSATGAIRLPRAFIAADAGEIINPDGLANQLEGGLIQAASWTLKEAVRFDPVCITSVDWETYPILTFQEVPEVEVTLLSQPGQKPLGAGEATAGPTPAAIGNAVFHATGVRLRELPFTPARVRRMLVAAEREGAAAR